MRTAVMGLPGAPTPHAYWNAQTPSALLGINPANGSKAAGAALPPTTVMGGDKAMVWYSPDSPFFWLLAVGGLTVFGITGASVKVRAFKRRASLDLGDA